MKTKLLIIFTITSATICGTILLLRATFNDITNFPKEIYYNSVPNITSGKHTSRIPNPPRAEDVDMTAEVYSVSLFGHTPDSQVYSGFSQQPYSIFGGAVGQKHKKENSTDINSLSIVNMPSGKTASRSGGLSGIMTTNSMDSGKGEQPFNQLDDMPKGTSPADKGNDEDIFYVPVGNGFWVLLLMLAVYLGWKIKKIKAR